jgi:hypothetical protein
MAKANTHNALKRIAELEAELKQAKQDIEWLKNNGWEGQPTKTVPIRSVRAVAQDLGISDTTMWRWRRSKWIETVTICGRPFVVLSSLKSFSDKAQNGTYAKPDSATFLRPSSSEKLKAATNS